MVEYQCSECSRVWDDELIRIMVKQDQYGKLYYEGIILSEKPVNSSTYPSTRFNTLEECLRWFESQSKSLQETLAE